MSKPLLTIGIPTFNRAANLSILLEAIGGEVRNSDYIEVIISDNASTDGTDHVCDRARASWPRLTVLRQTTNIGPERNFMELIRAAAGDYFWLIGDDDLPKIGTIRKIVDLLISKEPDLLYLGSEWVPLIKDNRQGQGVEKLNCMCLSQEKFALKVNVWMTFISAMIVNRNLVIAEVHSNIPEKYFGTNLVHLAWILPCLSKAKKVIMVAERCILATSANSGGYKVITTFGVNYPVALRKLLVDRPELVKRMVTRHMLIFLPQLILTIRRDDLGSRFLKESPWPEVRRTLSNDIFYCLLIYPLWRLPLRLALVYLRICGVLRIALRNYDRYFLGI